MGHPGSATLKRRCRRDEACTLYTSRTALRAQDQHLILDSQQLEAAIWSISEGRGSDDELAILRADERMSLSLLDRLIIEAEDDLASVRNLTGEERDQVVADFTDTLAWSSIDRGSPAASRPSRRPARRSPTTS